MSLKESASNIYEYHHKKNRKQNFSLFEKERGDFIQSMVSKKKWLDILDIWCRDGNLTKYFDINANTILWADIDRDAMKLANEKWIKTEYVDLNWDWNELWSKKFDVIWAFEIIEHLYFPDLVIEKIYNHLKEWW
jgi:2-polyprenyl-3-methyl-5-hydroxy-6-metoxy-1,4-benzoquinol methylase